MEADSRAHVTLSPIATPLPLTFIGLLIGSTVLSGLEVGWIPQGETQQVGWVLLAVPAPLHLVAGVFGFRGRSAAAATGSSTLATAWLGIALALIVTPPHGSFPSTATGMLAFGISAALLVPLLAELGGGSFLPAAVLAFASTRFLLTGIGGLTHDAGVKHATGWFGIAVAAFALYAALAFELEKPAVPTFRRGDAAEALVLPLEQQVAELEHEAGIRKSL